MTVLGIETSCDECAAAVVDDGRRIRSNVVLTQIPLHRAYQGVVPELASRAHTEWIMAVVRRALEEAALDAAGVDGVAVTAQPGLSGSLLVGLTFAKAFAWARRLPFIACDHLLAHLYASRLAAPVGAPTGTPPLAEEAGQEGALPPYPFIGLLASGGHTAICRVDDFDKVSVLGGTIDDAAGEAFDKVARHYGMGYPGGACIDRLAREGDPLAFRFPLPNLHKGEHRYDVSYSGLKTAVVNQLEQFRVKPRAAAERERLADIAASFQKAAVDMLLKAALRAVEDTGIYVVAAGGGVAANGSLRAQLAARPDIRCLFPPPELCGDNGAMVAGLGYQFLRRGDRSPFSTTARARVPAFKRGYP